MPFRYRIQVAWSEEDDVYVARVPALPGCMAHGATEADAAREARTAAELILEVMRENGDPIPPEEVLHDFSGNIRLRLPRWLHARLDDMAVADGVSLNQLMVALLAEGAGYRRGQAEPATKRPLSYVGEAKEAPRKKGRPVPVERAVSKRGAAKRTR